jgi:hypothetical protein
MCVALLWISFDDARSMHSTVDYKGRVGESLGLTLVKWGDCEDFDGVFSIGKGVTPLSERDQLILGDNGVKANHRLR